MLTDTPWWHGITDGGLVKQKLKLSGPENWKTGPVAAGGMEMRERTTHKVKSTGPGNLLDVKGRSKTNNHHLMSTHVFLNQCDRAFLHNQPRASTRSIRIMFYR